MSAIPGRALHTYLQSWQAGRSVNSTKLKYFLLLAERARLSFNNNITREIYLYYIILLYLADKIIFLPESTLTP